MAAPLKQQAPLKTVSISVAMNSRDMFFDHLKGFANQNKFAIRIVPVQPGEKHFIAEMLNDDLKIIFINPFDPEKFDVNFYSENEVSISATRLDSVLRKLRQTLGNINGVIFSD